MSDVIIPYRFVVKRDTAAAFTAANTLLKSGEWALEIDTKKMKMGDGVTSWNSLSYWGVGGDGVIGCTFDGGGTVLQAGTYCDVWLPTNCVITSATLLADRVGSVIVSVWSDTYANFPPNISDSITGAAPPTLTSAIKSQDTTLTGWTTSIAAGRTVRFGINSCSLIQRLTVALKVIKS